MDQSLEDRIRSHSYSPNPLVDRYVEQQRRRSLEMDHMEEQTIIRERHPSTTSVTSIHSRGDDQTDGHERCMTPVPDHQIRHDLHCIICRIPAINPFRCTTLEERNCVVSGNPLASSDSSASVRSVAHLCCYQCLGQNMIHRNSDRFRCPVCCVNEFNLNNLICANERDTREAEAYVIHCPNNCGLMGSPLALANHMCRFQSRGAVGYTPMSNYVPNLWECNTNLNEENMRMRGELGHVIRSLHSSRRQNRALQESAARDQVLLQLINNTNTNLRRRLEEKDQMIERLQLQKREVINQYKHNLKRVAKLYKIKVQELTEVNDRLKQELKELLDTMSGDVTTPQRWPRTDLSPTESGDEQMGFSALFASPPLFNSVDFPPLPTGSSSDEETYVSK